MVCQEEEVNHTQCMHKILVAMAFLSEHAKPLILWAGSAGILIADAAQELTSKTINSAEKIGSLPQTAILALIALVFGMVIWKQDKDAKLFRETREKKDQEREQRLLAVIERNSEAMEKMERETAKQTLHFEGIGQKLMDRGLNAPIHSRTTPITKRSNP